MERRSFSREFKVEAVRLVRERGISVAQAARDLDVHENLLRKWVKQSRTIRWRRSRVTARWGRRRPRSHG
jgi:transposase-like protein